MHGINKLPDTLLVALHRRVPVNAHFELLSQLSPPLFSQTLCFLKLFPYDYQSKVLN